MKMDVAVGQLDRVYCLPDSLISCAMGYILFAVQEVSRIGKSFDDVVYWHTNNTGLFFWIVL